MKKIFSFLLSIAILFLIAGPVLALTSGEAKNDWNEAQKARITAELGYKQAQLDYQGDKTPENDQAVIDSAKKVLNTALDEAEAWIIWKRLEAQEDSRVPSDIKNNIENDVAKNLTKIDGYRAEVNAIQNRTQVLSVFLKMIGGYVELVTDVARNTGAMWAYIGNELSATVENFENQLRTSALKLPENTEIISKLDVAKSEVKTAKSKIELAKNAYESVKLPGTPLVKFAEGNEYIRQARTNLLNAQVQLQNVYNIIITK